ncbi:MAG: hypothetical protein IJM98_06215 [Oscillospiraceae bacterium]|nr:hypothetical protein [Oscillospiraceae bacterium]
MRHCGKIYVDIVLKMSTGFVFADAHAVFAEKFRRIKCLQKIDDCERKRW